MKHAWKINAEMFWWENLVERDRQYDLDVNWKLMDVEVYDVRLLPTGLIWLRIGPSELGTEHSGSIKC
jgi:hypothetical protein